MTREERCEQRIEALVDRLDLDRIRAHELGPLAAVRWRAIGREVPSELLAEERATRLVARLTPIVLAAVRAAYSGPILLLKGPEIAGRYPQQARRYSDIDLLVRDPAAARAAFLAAGFENVDIPDVAAYHAKPIVMPGVPLNIELHVSPKWPSRLRPPDSEELFGSAVTSLVGVEGLQAPAPHHHALIVAAHGWAHTALRNARDLVDLAVMAAASDEAQIEEVAARWGVRRLWGTASATADWLLGDGTRPPLAVRVWARHLLTLRDATLSEAYLERWLSCFWILPPRDGVAQFGRTVAGDVRPRDGESWPETLRRLVHGVRGASDSRTARNWKAG
jgi:Uncharacterised nucleotidyltransferase